VDVAIAALAPTVSAGAGVGVTVDVPSVDVAIAAQAPTIAAGKTITIPAAAIAIAAVAPSVQLGDSLPEEETTGSASWQRAKKKSQRSSVSRTSRCAKTLCKRSGRRFLSRALWSSNPSRTPRTRNLSLSTCLG